jgi:PAS domain S-box-containing protein
MRLPPIANDAERVAALRAYGILDSAKDDAFDALVRVASSLCETPIALVGLIDERREWLLSTHGIANPGELPREITFCAHAIASRDVLVVEDATRDARFAENPLVTQEPRIRFYAGYPLIDQAGFALGTLCVLDQKPRTLSALQIANLRELATAMVRLLEARKIDNALFAAEQAEKRARADLDFMIDAASTSIIYWDTDRRMRFANRVALAWLGEEARGKHARELLGDELFAQNEPFMAAALDGQAQRFERVLHTVDGRKRHIDVTYTPDIRDGQALGFVAASVDITDLKAALLTSERDNALLKLAEEVAQVGHWRIEVGSELLYWSPEVFRIHGRDPATFVPTLTLGFEAYHPDDRARVSELVQRAAEAAQPFEFELRLLRPDGSIRNVECRGRCEVDPATGKTQAIVGVLQDVTDRNLLRERNARRDRLLTTGTLANGVGHEINNPLTYVTANIEFALDELTSIAGAAPDSRMLEILEVLGEAREGAGRIQKIVRGLKAFAREEATAAPTNVRAAVDVAIDLAVHELRATATLVTEHALVPLVLADESRLSQAILSLLVNAAQAFEVRDPSRNQVTVRTFATGDDRVAIEVEDNGPGIPADVLPRIYDPFFTTKSIGQGTGLGLAIAHAVVTSFGGEISCVTARGKGTTFRMVLAAVAPAARITKAPEAPATGRRGRILVIDDEPSVLRTIGRALKSEHEVVAVDSALEALRLLTEEPGAFDVIFCDLVMPIMSGMELYQRVKAHDPRAAARFVFETGGAADEELRAFLVGVPNERLEKPFGNESLRIVARKLVG